MNYRKLYEEHYRIKIPSNFHVHHIDLNRENNSIDNLILLPSRIHQKLHYAFYDLLQFNAEKVFKSILRSPQQASWYSSIFSLMDQIMPDIEYWVNVKYFEDITKIQGFNNSDYNYNQFRQ